MIASQNTDQSITQQSIRSNQTFTPVYSQQIVDEVMSDSGSLISEDLCGLNEPTQYNVVMETKHNGTPTQQELQFMASVGCESN